MKPNLLIKSILLLAGFVFHIPINAQDMYVKENTFVYASNQYVFVQNAIELNAATSNLYLRNDGQLLQGTTGAGANKGMGSLSVFQEGTVSNYHFNYWCSPVGNVLSATSINNPFGIGLLGRPNSEIETTPAIIMGTNDYDGTAFPLAVAPFWVNKFINTASYSDWVPTGASYSINPGEGFTMKGSSGVDALTINGVQNNPDGMQQRYDFRGKPNDGTISIAVLPEELTLIGNPYPSSIDLQAFLSEETNCTGIAYFWEQDKTINSHYLLDYRGGYGTYAGIVDLYVRAPFFSYDGSGNQIVGSQMGSGGLYERKYSPIGQGFMIEGNTIGNVQMKNSYRVFVKEGAENYSQFEKRRDYNKTGISLGKPMIRINTLLDNGPLSQMILVFDPTATDGVDRGMDAASPNDGPANCYFVINAAEYIIQAVPFDIDKKIAVGFRNYAEANYKISVNEMSNIPEVTDVFLHDKVTNVYYDIKNSFYDLTLPAGTYNSRYEITFKNGTLGVDTVESKSFVIHQDNFNKSLKINNPNQLELATCSIYDVVGRLIFTKKLLGNDSVYTIPTAEFCNGIYIVKLETNDTLEMSSKIIVKN